MFGVLTGDRSYTWMWVWRVGAGQYRSASAPVRAFRYTPRHSLRHGLRGAAAIPIAEHPIKPFVDHIGAFV